MKFYKKIFLMGLCAFFLGFSNAADAGLKKNILQYGSSVGCSLVGGWLFYCMTFHADDRESYSEPPQDNYRSDFSNSWETYLVAGIFFEVAAACIVVLPFCKKFWWKKETQEEKESSMKEAMQKQTKNGDHR